MSAWERRLAQDYAADAARMSNPAFRPRRCPGCRGLVIDNDWADHEECQIEAARARHDETDRDDYDEPRTA